MKIALIASLLILASCSGNGKLTQAEMIELMSLRQKESMDIGRYQYVPQSDGYVNRGKLIDTKTGKIWQDTCHIQGKKECDISAWTEETVIGLNFSEDAWSRYVEVIKAKREPSSICEIEKDEAKSVRGYIKSNGTYVAPYIRTSPNGTTYDNIRPRQ